MKVGILGSGDVGKSLAKGFTENGHDVMIGTRNPDKLDELKNEIEISIGDFNKTADFGEIIILAVKGSAAKNVLAFVGEDKLDGKIIIDTTNPIADVPPENGVLKFFTSFDNSLMEQLQSEFPKARFVKAFNSIGHAHMANPDFESKPTMFICGNDEAAKKEASQIINQFGFEVEDMGKMEAARAIEPLCILWCIPGFLRNDWSHAFKLLKKPE